MGKEHSYRYNAITTCVKNNIYSPEQSRGSRGRKVKNSMSDVARIDAVQSEFILNIFQPWKLGPRGEGDGKHSDVTK